MSLRRLLIAVVCLGITLSVASNNGLCVLEASILGDEDYFRAAIHEVINDPVGGVAVNVAGGSIFKEVRTQRYANPDELLSENPNCCRFVPANSGDGGPEVSLLDRICGVRTVEVSYDKRYLEDDVKKTSRTNAKVAVTSCGTARPFR
jgi:hypothetical protein